MEQIEDAVLVDEAEKAFSEGYKKAYEELMASGNYTPRRARRYLDSIAKRNLKKYTKTIKKNNQTGTVSV